MNNDAPKIWVEPVAEDFQFEDDIPTTEIMMAQQEPPLPTIEERKDIVAQTALSTESKSMLGSLIEMNEIANTLAIINTEESQEQRKTVLNAWCEGFVNARMRNNATSEKLKAALLNRLIDNIENLDLETTARIYNDLTDVSATDAQQAMSTVMGGGVGSASGAGGINLTINNATAEGAAITSNTLNTGGEQVQQLKETVTLNSAIQAWSNVPLPKKKIEPVE